MDLQTYYVFLLAAVVLVLAPGPDTLLVLSRSLASGANAGLMTLIGTQAGNIVHALLAGLGLSSIILLFPYAFEALKYAGAAYLVYLAVMSWRSKATLELDPKLARRTGSPLRYFYQGFVNNMVNPKVILFFIALLPQFVNPAESVALQSLLLGSTVAVLAIMWMGALALLTGRFRERLAGSPTFLKVANKLAALTFFGLACRLAIQER